MGLSPQLFMARPDPMPACLDASFRSVYNADALRGSVAPY